MSIEAAGLRAGRRTAGPQEKPPDSPQLAAVALGEGAKVDPQTVRCESLGARREITRLQILDEARALSAAIAPPGLHAMSSVIGREDHRPANGSQLAWCRGARPDHNVAHKVCWVSSAVADPKFLAVGTVVGDKEKPTPGSCQ